MLINKEPAAIIGGLAEVIKSVFPLLLAFGIITWTSPQIGQVMFLIGVVVGFAEKLFIRQSVVSPDTANKQIQEGINSPKGTKIETVIAKVEANDAISSS